MTGPVFTFRGEVVAKNFIFLCEPINDTRLVDIVRRHMQFYTIANCEANKTFAHFAGNVRQHEMFIRQSDAKHCAGKNRCNRSFHLDSLL